MAIFSMDSYNRGYDAGTRFLRRHAPTVVIPGPRPWDSFRYLSKQNHEPIDYGIDPRLGG